VHWTLDAQEVVRAVPATRNVEAGPGLEGEKLLPEASRMNPPAEPAYELVGEIEKISGLAVIVTVAGPDWLVSAELVATTSTRAGEGTAAGAVYSPAELTEPQAPGWPQPAPDIDHVTWGLFVPVTLAVNCSIPVTPIDALAGCTLTPMCARIVTVAAALSVPPAKLVATMVTGFGDGKATGAM
jgi:hypothetical protein